MAVKIVIIILFTLIVGNLFWVNYRLITGGVLLADKADNVAIANKINKVADNAESNSVDANAAALMNADNTEM